MFLFRRPTSHCGQTKCESRRMGCPPDGSIGNEGNAKSAENTKTSCDIRPRQLCSRLSGCATYSSVGRALLLGWFQYSSDLLRRCRASVDCVRLWNTSDLWQPDSNMKRTKSGVPFRIVAGHHGGTISSIREYSVHPLLLLADCRLSIQTSIQLANT